MVIVNPPVYFWAGTTMRKSVLVLVSFTPFAQLSFTVASASLDMVSILSAAFTVALPDALVEASFGVKVIDLTVNSPNILSLRTEQRL